MKATGLAEGVGAPGFAAAGYHLGEVAAFDAASECFSFRVVEGDV